MRQFTQINHERFGGGDGRAINRHSEKEFKLEGLEGVRFFIDKNLSCSPPSYELSFVRDGFQGIVPTIPHKIKDGETWPNAQKQAFETILDYVNTHDVIKPRYRVNVIGYAGDKESIGSADLFYHGPAYASYLSLLNVFYKGESYELRLVGELKMVADGTEVTFDNMSLKHVEKYEAAEAGHASNCQIINPVYFEWVNEDGEQVLETINSIAANPEVEFNRFKTLIDSKQTANKSHG